MNQSTLLESRDQCQKEHDHTLPWSMPEGRSQLGAGSLVFPFSVGGTMETIALENRFEKNTAFRAMEAEFMCAKTAAAFLGIPLRSLYHYVQQGLLPSYKLGRHRLFRKIDLLNALQATRVTTVAEILR
ncbi:MAG: helix-turn-helix domain-containing protein [Terrimicrobiaceae bacterium]|nr:helix-turn-helix domain-containing protein [Terrimicrobiaceae bacterium]